MQTAPDVLDTHPAPLRCHTPTLTSPLPIVVGALVEPAPIQPCRKLRPLNAATLKTSPFPTRKGGLSPTQRLADGRERVDGKLKHALPRRVLGTGDCLPARANALPVASRCSSTLASRSPRRDRHPPTVGTHMFRFGQVLSMGWALRTVGALRTVAG
jgi:hypothetical protein